MCRIIGKVVHWHWSTMRMCTNANAKRKAKGRKKNNNKGEATQEAEQGAEGMRRETKSCEETDEQTIVQVIMKWTGCLRFMLKLGGGSVFSEWHC